MSRTRKLLETKGGKKTMRQFGKVEIPQEAVIAALKMDGQVETQPPRTAINDPRQVLRPRTPQKIWWSAWESPCRATLLKRE